MTQASDISDNVDQMLGIFDKKQKRAVDAIVDEWSASGDEEFIFPLVDGPPGTGKTTVGTTAVADYLLEHRRGQVIYACYTHFATSKAQENLYEKLGLTPNQAIRLTPNPKDTDWTRGVVGTTYNFSNLSRHNRRRLKECSVLLCTLHGSRRASKVRRRGARVVVDEFSQVNPPMFFATIWRVRYLYPNSYALLGDPRQLPLITTQPMLKPNIGLFIMKRKPYDPHKLIVQHRMHEDICEGVNSIRQRVFHTYPIKSGKDVKDRDLLGLDFSWDRSKISDSKVQEILDPEYPFVIVDTDGLGGSEEKTFGKSIRNAAEANLAAKLAKASYDSYEHKDGKHLKPTILSPYSAQVQEIRRRLPIPLKKHCITIYRSQGREYPCVIISFVRHDLETGFIGFLADPQLRAQTYVGCSRAQGKLILLLSCGTFIGHEHLDFESLYKTTGAHKVEVA